MAGYINPVGIIGGDATSAPNTLKANQNTDIRIAYQAKEVNSDSTTYYAGPSANDVYAIYGNGLSIGLTSIDYPFVWTSPKSGGTAGLIELINGLPNRPAGTQYTEIEPAMSWLMSQNCFFVISENYPWQKWPTPITTIDAAVPSSSGFQYDLRAFDISGNNGGNDYYSYGASSLAFANDPENAYWNIINASQILTSYTSFALAGDFVISTWFYIDTPPTAGQFLPLFSIGDYKTNGCALALSYDGFRYGDNSAGLNSLPNQTISTPGVWTGGWHNILISLETTSFNAWLDGTQVVSTGTLGGFVPGAGHQIKVGGTPHVADGTFGNRLSYFSISNHTLSGGAFDYYTAWTDPSYNGRY
jgi:hypothetical protein